MALDPIDWLIIVAYLLLAVGIGWKLKKGAEGNISDFFLGGRKLPWYIAGISMVATTFAADTPLWVTEKIAQYGISGNWIWWNMLIGGMLTTFFFAKLWRRAGVLTELEFIELRYGGKPASALRGFKAVYMGLFLNMVIIAWVNVALMTILEVFFGLSYSESFWIMVALMFFVILYSSLAGLKGVAVLDTVQFFIAMGACIVLAVIVLNEDKIGGISGLKAQLPEWRFDFFPKIESGNMENVVGSYSLTLASFLTFGMVQWWSSWYPGAEPGGGGYVSQRMMSARSEKDALYATLFFQIAHYCLRPWPWIIVALCALVLYPELEIEESRKGFVFIMRDFLPAGLKGLLLIAFFSAYMSTISTQLNWGASYLTNDLYKRFLKSEDKYDSQETAQLDYVRKARLFTVFISVCGIVATTFVNSIDSAATFLIECGAGLGMVLILRWYWWRINAWSEISATLMPFIAYTIGNFVLNLPYPYSFLFTVGVTTVTWLVVTFLTAPENHKQLADFYERVRPMGNWKPVATSGRNKGLLRLIIAWISAITMTYSLLFCIGKLIFQWWDAALIWGIVSVVSFVVLKFSFKNDSF